MQTPVHLITALAATAALVTGCAAAPSPPGSDLRDHLEQRQGEFFAAVATRGADRMAALFDVDAVLHVANMPPIEGREAIHTFYGNMFRFLSGSEATPESLHVAASGDLAYGIGRVTNEFRGADGLVAYAGKYALIWRRSGDDWLIALYSVSSNQPSDSR